MTMACKRLVRSVALGGAAFALALPAPALGQIILAQAQDLSSLSIEELAALEITTVSRRAEPLNEAAAIFVITRDDIRRSGAESIPDALRLAPNLHVARMSANGYGISARGFNHSTGTANKLLVLIDGRSIYTSLYSGVFWDTQNFPLDDIERIEVISGPGGTLWGANAVNGVINIITRNSADTQGVMARAGYGNLERNLTARFGGTLADGLTYRVYGMGFQRGPVRTAAGSDAGDEWESLQAGWRMDYMQGSNEISIFGDIYNGWSEPIAGSVSDGEVHGGNVVARWRHMLSDNANFDLQAYYDWSGRTVTTGIDDFRETFDIQGDLSLAAGTRHQIVLGGGYRASWDEFMPGPGTAFLAPAGRTLELANAFLQDEIALQDTLSLTLGIKLEHNSYTGLEYMPSGHLSWAVTETDFLWASISRAVRTPSRFDRDLFVTGLLAGGPDFMSENLVAYEIGYRGQPLEGLSFSLSGFYNVYDDLRTAEAPPVGVFPFTVGNEMEGETYGIELWGNYSIRDWWRVSAGLSTLQKDLRLKPASRDLFGVAFAGNDPEYQLLLRSSMNITDALELDLMMRAIDELPSPRVPGYVELDARLGWHLSDALEVSLAGSNLLNARHEEFRNASTPMRKVPRAFHISARWSL